VRGAPSGEQSIEGFNDQKNPKKPKPKKRAAPVLVTPTRR